MTARSDHGHGTRVLLAYPPSGQCLREDRCQVPSGNPLMSPLLPPTDLMCLAAVGERSGALCRIEDYSSREGSLDGVIDEIRRFRPDLICIALSTPTLGGDLEFCSAAKRAVPDAAIIAKGAHALLFDRELLERCPGLDMVMRGEPELTFQDILSGKERPDIPGLTWRRPDGAVVRNADRPFNDHLDDLPFPARHLVDNRRYRRPDTGAPQAVIRVSRGCPYHCFYCLATPVSGTQVRRRSPGNILAEVRECVETYGIRDFLFWSDVFNSDRAWVLSLCETLRSSGLNICWAANSRADLLDREVAAAMRGAGCCLVSVGVESGSQDLLDRTGKKLDLELVMRGIDVLKDAGIPTIAYYQFGLPWETRETAEETMRFALELNSDYANFFVSTPLPGTRFYDYALRQGWLEGADRDGARGFGGAYLRPVTGGHFLGKQEIELLQRRAAQRYFLRPGYLLKNLLRVRWSRDTFRSLLSFGRGLMQAGR